MKAISVHAPWSWLFFPDWFDRVPDKWRTLGPNGPKLLAAKDAENRAGNSPAMRSIRAQLETSGPFDLLIHASKSATDDDVWWSDWFDLHFLPVGQLVGVVEAYAVKFRALGESEAFSPWHERLTYAVYVRNPRRFARAVAYRGYVHLFDVPKAAIRGVPELEGVTL